MRAARVGAVALLAVLLPGCVSLFGAPEGTDAPSMAPDDAADKPETTMAIAAASPAPARALPVEVRVDGLWLRPVQPQVATLDAPGATRVEWYVGVEGIHPAVQVVNGHPYVTAEPGKAAEHPASTGPLAPGAAAAMVLRDHGRHLFALAGSEDARLVVTVSPAVEDDARAIVFLVKDETGARFLPERVAVRPGAGVSFVNQAADALEASRTAFQPWIGTGTARLEMTPVDEGLYALVADVADEADGRGEAQARFLVDFDRPATRHEHAFDGGFLGALAPPGEPEEDVFHVRADHPVVLLELAVNVTGPPIDEPSVRVLVEREGEVLGEAVATREGASLALRELPSGAYDVRVLPEGGALVDYAVKARLLYRLPVPEQLREG